MHYRRILWIGLVHHYRKRGVFGFAGTGVLPPRVYFIPLVVIIPLYLVLYGMFQLYTPKRVMRKRVELANICKANTIGLFDFLPWCCTSEEKIHIFTISPGGW